MQVTYLIFQPVYAQIYYFKSEICELNSKSNKIPNHLSLYTNETIFKLSNGLIPGRGKWEIRLNYIKIKALVEKEMELKPDLNTSKKLKF